MGRFGTVNSANMAEYFKELNKVWQMRSGQQNMFLENKQIQTAITAWNATPVLKTSYPNIVDYIDSQVPGYKNDFTNIVDQQNYNRASSELGKNAAALATISSIGLNATSVANLVAFSAWLETNKTNLMNNGIVVGNNTTPITDATKLIVTNLS